MKKKTKTWRLRLGIRGLLQAVNVGSFKQWLHTSHKNITNQHDSAYLEYRLLVVAVRIFFDLNSLSKRTLKNKKYIPIILLLPQKRTAFSEVQICRDLLGLFAMPRAEIPPPLLQIQKALWWLTYVIIMSHSKRHVIYYSHLLRTVCHFPFVGENTRRQEGCAKPRPANKSFVVTCKTIVGF